MNQVEAKYVGSKRVGQRCKPFANCRAVVIARKPRFVWLQMVRVRVVSFWLVIQYNIIT